jgi:hypothetical protein
MKPTMKNIRKISRGMTDLRELQILKDNITFYIAGLKDGSRDHEKYEDLYHEAMSALQFIKDQAAGEPAP